MASKTCMNVSCGVSSSIAWRKGWVMQCGDFATLCDKCGSVYEKSIFCDVFHSKDSGWRECNSCGKLLHCGCIASRFLIELLDSSGVNCVSCPKSSEPHPIASDEKPNEFDALKVNNACELQSTSTEDQLDGVSVDKMKNMQMRNDIEGIGLGHLLQSQNDDTTGFFGLKQEEVMPRETVNTRFSNFILSSNESSRLSKLDSCKTNIGPKDMYESLSHPNLSISLGAPLGNQNVFHVDEREHSKNYPFQQVPRSRHLLPKPPKSALSVSFEANAGMVSQIRVARPPAEGRGKNQLLPRYWPRITDQELQQICENSNSTIVPLFEKVLSASDAGRIGRLVLPKACAEAYFPPISQPEGIPLRIQDVKGKEWVFQFRFWPNNNSRMYVLEGVTPCIQSMQLQAGDTVTFSRMDPEGKLVMGFRKALNTCTKQDTQPSAIPNGPQSTESLFSGVFENLPIVSGYSGLLQSLKGTTDPHLNALTKNFSSASGDIGWHKTKKHDGRTREGLLLPPLLIPERKRARNIGSKSKRLLIDSQDALELKLTWEEAQDLICPPPSIKPSIVLVGDYEFEEYEEPPVFGKRSIFIVRSNGEQEQWAQCDSCFRWRRLPVDVVLPSKWTCVENASDQSRSSCSAPDELNPKELEDLLRLNKEFKKQRLFSQTETLEHESSGLDALANAAILGDDVGKPGTTSVAATTRHPRHRPGCSCIVCIQPPSGKGKHKPTCTCNVCMTVRRRFKTLMLRKKKRQSERDAEIALRNQHMWGPKDEPDVDSSSRLVLSHLDSSETEGRMTTDLESKSQSNNGSGKLPETGKGEIDLNCHPGREHLQVDLTRMSMMSLLQVANLPLETYLKQNGLTSLVANHQAGSQSQVPLPTSGDVEVILNDDCCSPQERVQEPESGGEENEPDQSENNSP